MKKPENMEKVLNSLDNVRRSPAPEGFEERLMSRLAQDHVSSHFTRWIQIGLAAMISMVILNIATLAFVNSQSNQTEEITIVDYMDPGITYFNSEQP